jgi:hypothetical protein
VFVENIPSSEQARQKFPPHPARYPQRMNDTDADRRDFAHYLIEPMISLRLWLISLTKK